MIWLLPATVCLLGAQLIVLGPWWLGGLLIVFGLRKGWRGPKVFLIVAILIGLASAWHERQLTLSPPIPTGTIRVQPTAWKVTDGFATYTGTASNGVPVTGGGRVDAQGENTIKHLNTPVLLANPGAKERIAGPRNLYEFDYAKYAWAQYHQAYRFTGKTLALQAVPVSGIVDRLYTLRLWLLRRMDNLPKQVALYAKALLLGVLDDDGQMRETFSKLGIIHLFSVSGLHIFAIVGMLYALTNRLRIPKEITDVALLCILPAMLIIIPPGAGIVRAVWLRLTQLVGQKCKLPLTTFDYLCIVFAVNLVVQPRMLWTLGGQMTYLLTFVLITAPSVNSLRQSLRMALVSAPPLLHAVFGLHLLTFVFNWLLMPLFESILMPALLFAVVWPSCPLVAGLNQLIIAAQRGLAGMAKLPGYLNFGALPFLLTVILTVLVVRTVAVNKWRMLLLGVCIAYLVVNVHPQWRVVVVDVGQGDSIIIEAPFKSATVLIDTGGRGFGQSRNPPAKRTTLNYLAARGVNHLDALVLTHPDADHVGDSSVITKGIRVREIVTAPISANDETIRQAQADGHTKMHTVMAGSNLQYGPLRLRVVAPDRINTEDTNPNSVILYGTIGDSNWLFTGDADQTVEKEQLMPQNLAVDFLKVGHHGSKTASAPEFIQQIHPQVGLISAGVANRYGHPNVETLRTFSAANVPLVMTNQSGMIWVDASSKKHRLHTFLGQTE
ncbi:DNA internalization-related competence protein ComEC/Rec2 [Lacticaseibacillus hulanensis]|uniref:DNA internalization-related competence protein ComEC/Rec2 n=1 Tax=Lacticaseibacillus hulanensis TaxID=2493111 RepID=UPI000FDA05E1|nr:DNA internalization-related competence protein ComEC/Rec2 [Lacticaseibacillus hulanensis]